MSAPPSRASRATLLGEDDPVILDVRSRHEYLRGHVPGAIHLPFWRVSRRRVRTLSLALDVPVVVYCGMGPRAWWAAFRLRRLGFRSIRCLPGHMQAWRRAGRAEVQGPA